MKAYEGYLIDLDGTMYLGQERIEAAPGFIRSLKDAGKKHLYVTNNSTRTQEQVAAKLRQMDIDAKPEDVFTTSMATAAYIREHNPKARVYAIGEEGLFDALAKEELTVAEEDCDYVVIGLDTSITYEKLAKACLLVRAGATFLSTNSDRALPTEAGLMPGNGSLTAVISVSTGIEPTFIGKPENIMMEQARKLLDLEKQQVLMVGDNYLTDITAGIRAGMDTLMVCTGFTKREELPLLEPKPTYTIDSLDEWEIK
ncbi:TIGR01457 family HAD-type hydrolase [Terribacillus saccharophilus]|uniref:TIGR01457 family HAD-type hydrolase n=1 Tax=Terribacillus saccharophilus TaxID=361277 RepID=UPI00398233FE